MAKSGEGSRGGHIIGHTKNGAPIYGSAADHAAKVQQGKPHAGMASKQMPKERSMSDEIKEGASLGGLFGSIDGIRQVGQSLSNSRGHPTFGTVAGISALIVGANVAVGAAAGAAVGAAIGGVKKLGRGKKAASTSAEGEAQSPTSYEQQYKKAYDANGGQDISAEEDNALRKKFGTKKEQ